MIFVDPDFVSKMDELADPAKAAVHTRDPVFMKNLQKMVKGGAISGPGLVIASSMLCVSSLSRSLAARKRS